MNDNKVKDREISTIEMAQYNEENTVPEEGNCETEIDDVDVNLFMESGKAKASVQYNKENTAPMIISFHEKQTVSASSTSTEEINCETEIHEVDANLPKESGKAKASAPPVPKRQFTNTTEKENTSEIIEKNRIDNHNPKQYTQAKIISTPQSEIKVLDGTVELNSLKSQLLKKAVRRGLEFNLLIAGQCGLGKSTLVNSLFLSEIYDCNNPGPFMRVKETVTVEESCIILKENGVNLFLTIIDTPGFAEGIDNSNNYQPISNYIDSKFEEYLNAECSLNRVNYYDMRVHCCLYFISPTSRGLSALDVNTMKKLCNKVNIIPIIAKADTMTTTECMQFKKQILRDLKEQTIKIFDIPDTSDGSNSLNDKLPFAVIGATTTFESGGKLIRGRQYPWGIVDIENSEYCDTGDLRRLLLKNHLLDLVDSTKVHYENYIRHSHSVFKIMSESEEHYNRKKEELQKFEDDMIKSHSIAIKKLEQENRELEAYRAKFEEEKKKWEQENNITLEQISKLLPGTSSERQAKKQKKNVIFHLFKKM